MDGDLIKLNTQRTYNTKFILNKKIKLCISYENINVIIPQP